MAKINFTDEHLANLRDKIATAVMNNIVINGPMGQQYSTIDIIHNLSINSLRTLIKLLDKQINALSLEDEWVENPNEEAIKNFTFKRDFINLALGYKLACEEEAKKEHQLNALNSKLEALKESQKTPEDRIKEIEDQIAALQ
jgi:predicted  nucleic acid-binding Zn-ribbon protein